jgi:hypothetical protein
MPLGLANMGKPLPYHPNCLYRPNPNLNPKKVHQNHVERWKSISSQPHFISIIVIAEEAHLVGLCTGLSLLTSDSRLNRSSSEDALTCILEWGREGVGGLCLASPCKVMHLREGAVCANRTGQGPGSPLPAFSEISYNYIMTPFIFVRLRLACTYAHISMQVYTHLAGSLDVC